MLAIMALFAIQAFGQEYDYLSILRSFYPIPENTLTAGKEEKESFKKKLEVINSLLWDLEDIQKEEERRRESEPFPFDLNNMNKYDAAKEKWDRLFDQVLDVTMAHAQIEVDIVNEWRAYVSTQLAGDGEDKHSIYKQLNKKYKDNLHELMHDCIEMAPIIKELDNLNVDGYKISPNTAGLFVLREVYKSMEGIYFYNLNTEKDPIEGLMEIKQLFKDISGNVN